VFVIVFVYLLIGAAPSVVTLGIYLAIRTRRLPHAPFFVGWAYWLVARLAAITFLVALFFTAEGLDGAPLGNAPWLLALPIGVFVPPVASVEWFMRRRIPAGAAQPPAGDL
jgi:hypothetical protein